MFAKITIVLLHCLNCLFVWNMKGVAVRSAQIFNVNKNLIIDTSQIDVKSSGQKVRLRGVDRKFTSGRLEILFNEKWHLICDKYFTAKDADVACNSLGFHNGAKTIWRESKFGNGFLNQFLPLKLNCNGNETDLQSCSNIPTTINCDPVTDTVGVECKENYASYCSQGEVAFGDLCYRTVKREATFEEASEYCHRNSGSLVTIKDQYQMDFISEILFYENNEDSYINLWFIGGHKTDDSNAWMWLSKVPMGSTNFTKWKPAFQQKYGRNCLALIRNESSLANREYYFWENVRCNEQLNFICQRKLDIVKGCQNPQNKRKFDGTVTVTVDGVQCARWNDPAIWRRRLLFRGQTMMDHNYCRNPDNDKMPWCIIDPKRVGYCDVPLCSNPTFPKCSEHEIQCSTEEDDQCISSDFICDFDKDCPNGSDEQNCPDCGKTRRRIVRSASDGQDLEPVPWGKVARIVGGFETSPGSYPWMASIRTKESNRHYCGASLIDKFHVVTAAHCFDKDRSTNAYTVVLGEWDMSQEEPTELKLEIDEIMPHPNYKNSKDDDIAILRLKTNDSGVPFSEYIQPICLSTRHTAVSRNTKCYVSGWGSNGETSASRMQAAQIPVIPRTQCARPDVYGADLSTKSFCAGYLTGGIDTCIGDSGGPFACEVNGRYFLFGMVSWGEGCAEKNKPGVYTSIKEYTGWIREKIMKLQLTI